MTDYPLCGPHDKGAQARADAVYHHAPAERDGLAAGLRERAEQAEAAIERVRVVLATNRESRSGYLRAAVREALDGA